MKAIGAMELSEEAKALEAAGKEGDIPYILSHPRKNDAVFYPGYS